MDDINNSWMRMCFRGGNFLWEEAEIIYCQWHLVLTGWPTITPSGVRTGAMTSEGKTLLLEMYPNLQNCHLHRYFMTHLITELTQCSLVMLYGIIRHFGQHLISSGKEFMPESIKSTNVDLRNIFQWHFVFSFNDILYIHLKILFVIFCWAFIFHQSYRNKIILKLWFTAYMDCMDPDVLCSKKAPSPSPSPSPSLSLSLSLT